MVVKSQDSLVEAVQKGHVQSFAALYERYYKAMVALAYSILADTHLAEDAAQQAFAIACRNLPKLKSKEKFAPWLTAICRNNARQMLRQERKTVPVEDQSRVHLQNQDGEDEGENRRRAVLRAVWKLRPIHREPLVLRYYDNMSYVQIASVLGISRQAVQGRLTRAKQRIREYLKRNGFAGGNHEII